MINLNFSDRTNIPSFHKHRNCCFLCTFTSNTGGLAAVSEGGLSAPQPDGCGSAWSHLPTRRVRAWAPGVGAPWLTPHRLSETSPASRAVTPSLPFTTRLPVTPARHPPRPVPGGWCDPFPEGPLSAPSQRLPETAPSP